LAQIYAYIRISDKYKQNSSTQENSISNYASDNGLIINHWVEEHVSGSRTEAGTREISNLISKLEPGDKIICTEISRLGRNKPFSIIGLIHEITDAKQSELHLTYSDQCITPENSENAEVLFTTVAGSYVARQEAIKRSERAKAAIVRRKGAGLSNGRPEGLLVKSKLDEHENYIIRSLNDNLNKSALAKELECSRATMIRWLQARDKIHNKAKELKIDIRKPISFIKNQINLESNL
jgi:DNA invertase Pin-like site-specific DNA recombinase